MRFPELAYVVDVVLNLDRGGKTPHIHDIEDSSEIISLEFEGLVSLFPEWLRGGVQEINDCRIGVVMCGDFGDSVLEDFFFVLIGKDRICLKCTWSTE